MNTPDFKDISESIVHSNFPNQRKDVEAELEKAYAQGREQGLWEALNARMPSEEEIFNFLESLSTDTTIQRTSIGIAKAISEWLRANMKPAREGEH